jgi:DNA-binding transcriptional regulator YiaG
MKNKNPLTVALDIANDLKLDKLTLKEIELLQVPKVKELSPSQIRKIREKENASQGS